MDSQILIPIRPLPPSFELGGLAVCVILIIFSCITVALRFWTRTMIVRILGYDDLMILVTLVTPIGQLDLIES